MTEDMGGNSRYKAKRNQGYDMQRDFQSSFDAIPGPVAISSKQKPQTDPLVERLKGLRDDTLPNYGRKDL